MVLKPVNVIDDLNMIEGTVILVVYVVGAGVGSVLGKLEGCLLGCNESCLVGFDDGCREGCR